MFTDLKELRRQVSAHLENHGAHKMPISNVILMELLDRLEKAECDSRVFMREKNEQWREIQDLQAECVKLKSGWDSSHAAYVKAVTR